MAQLTTLNSYTSPSVNPRTQINPVHQHGEGTELWFGWSIMLAADWPVLTNPLAFTTFAEIYGPPNNGASPLRFGLNGGNFAILRASDGVALDIPWQLPLFRSRWMDCMLHTVLSRDSAVGFHEWSINTGSGWVQQPLNGQQRLYMSTLDATNYPGPQACHLKNYRSLDQANSTTLYYGAHKVATSFAKADPRTYG